MKDDDRPSYHLDAAARPRKSSSRTMGPISHGRRCTSSTKWRRRIEGNAAAKVLPCARKLGVID